MLILIPIFPIAVFLGLKDGDQYSDKRVHRKVTSGTKVLVWAMYSSSSAYSAA
jgi:hypothetical protein